MSARNKRMPMLPLMSVVTGALLLSPVVLAQSVPPRAAPQPLMPPSSAADAVPSTPSASGISKGALEELGADRIGLLDESSGALPDTMWDGSDPIFVRAILPRLPRKMNSLAMRRLAHNMLLPQSRQPQAASDPFAVEAAEGAPGESVAPAETAAWLLEARVTALAAMGDWQNVAALLELVPMDRMTGPLEKLKVDAMLATDKTDAACTEAQAALARTADDHWQKLQVFCQFNANQTSAAQLGLSLLREQGVEAPAFFWAADLIQGNRPLTPNGLQRLTPLELAMLRKAGRTFPDAVVRDGDPTLLRVLAQMPVPAVEDEKLNDTEKKDRARLMQEARIVVAERAVAAGALDPEDLRALYLALDLSQDAQPPQLAQATADSVRARAHMYQLAKAQTVPAAQAEVIARAVELTRADRGEKGPDLVVVGRVYAPLLTEFTPAPDLIWFSGHAARALLAAGVPDKAAAWFDLARQMARTSIEAAEIADGLWALEHLGGIGASSGVTPQAIRSWQATVPGPVAIASRERLLNLLAALGDAVPAAEWLPVISAPTKPIDAVHPPVHVWQGLALAARDARLGDAVALALVALGEEGPHRSSPLTLHRVIESLMVAGRDKEARALALEAALVQGL
ncbi:MAG: hypothetical protein SFV19_02235 [Rhodospirillaceae bacterium]|nr:hypothetical protein [Rhodospirillaceae bacterium]